MTRAGAVGRARDVYLGVRHLIHEFARFGVVGLCAFVVDVGAFNLLQYAGGSGPLHGHPLLAKTVSVALATTVAFVGNRNWTFRHRSRSGLGREYVLFFVFSGIGLAIALVCLWVSHDVLGLTSPIADNIAANGVGLALGAVFRFWSYRRFVFPALAASDPPGDRAAPKAPIISR